MSNANPKFALINFNMPKHLKYSLDRLCKFKHISRTAVINMILEDWVRKELELLENDGRIYELMSGLEETITRSVLYHRDESNEIESFKPKSKSWEDSY